MANPTVNDVLAVLPGGRELNESTRPTYSEVVQWIADNRSKLNVAIEQAGIDPTALTTDQEAEVNMAVKKETAYMLMVSAGASPEANDETPAWVSYHKEYEALLKRIVEQWWASPTSSDSLPSSRTMDATDNSATDPDDPTMQPKFDWSQKW